MSEVNSVVAGIVEFFKFSSVILDLFLINFMEEETCSHLQVTFKYAHVFLRFGKASGDRIFLKNLSSLREIDRDDILTKF